MLTAFPVTATPQDVGLPPPEAADLLAGAMFRLVLARLVPGNPVPAQPDAPAEASMASVASLTGEEIDDLPMACDAIDIAASAVLPGMSEPELTPGAIPHDPGHAPSPGFPVLDDVAPEIPEPPDSPAGVGPFAMAGPDGQQPPVSPIPGEKALVASQPPPRAMPGALPESRADPQAARVSRPVGSALSRAILESRLLPATAAANPDKALAPVASQQPPAVANEALAPTPLAVATPDAPLTPLVSAPWFPEPTAPRAEAVATEPLATPTSPSAELKRAGTTQADTRVAGTTVATTIPADMPVAGTPAARTTLADPWVSSAPAAITSLPDARVSSAPVATIMFADARIASAPVATIMFADARIASAPVATTTVADMRVASTPVFVAPVADARVAGAAVPTSTLAEVPVATTPVAETSVATTPVTFATPVAKPAHAVAGLEKSAGPPDQAPPPRAQADAAQTVPPADRPQRSTTSPSFATYPGDLLQAVAQRVAASGPPTASPVQPVQPSETPTHMASTPASQAAIGERGSPAPLLPVEPGERITVSLPIPMGKAGPDPMVRLPARVPEAQIPLPIPPSLQASAVSLPRPLTDPVRTDPATEVAPADSPRIDAPRLDPIRAETPRPVLPAAVARQLAEAIPPVDGPGFDLSLSPEELGQVRLRLTSAEGGTLLIVQAERPETLELLRRHIGSLEQELRDLGHEGLTLRFSGGGGGDAAPHRSPDLAPLQDSDTSRFAPLPAPGPAESRPMPRGLTEHLDLRL